MADCWSLDGYKLKSDLVLLKHPWSGRSAIETAQPGSPTGSQGEAQKKKMAWHYITITSILQATKKTAPHIWWQLHLPLPRLLSDNNLHSLNRNLRSKLCYVEHKASPLVEGWRIYRKGLSGNSCHCMSTPIAILYKLYSVSQCLSFPTCRNYTHSITDIYGTSYAFTPFPCVSQCIKIGFPANNLLFHMYQISGRCSMIKLTQVVLLWNSFLLEELSSYQKSPVCTESFTL